MVWHSRNTCDLYGLFLYAGDYHSPYCGWKRENDMVLIRNIKCKIALVGKKITSSVIFYEKWKKHIDSHIM